MDVMKCSHCSFVGFAHGGCCKRCGHSNTAQNSRISHLSLSGRLPPRFRKLSTLLAAGAVFIAIIVGVVVVRAQLKRYFDQTPAQLEAISKSGKFEETTTIRVNQRPIPMAFITNGAFGYRRRVIVAKTTRVLEGLGFLKVLKTTSQSTWEVPVYGRVGGTDEYVNISLTEKGVGESANWRSTAEPYPGASEKALWWLVPIGTREITGIESVNEPEPKMVDVAIHWRWHPNQIGEGFDCGGSVIGSLPEDAQASARSLGWNSQIEYTANATLRRVGRVWEVVYINFPNERE